MTLHRKKGQQMRTVNDMKITITKKKLLERLHENRRKHEEVYREARDAFLSMAREELRTRVRSLEDTNAWPSIDTNRLLRFSLPAPVSYAHEYTEVIDMLDMSDDKELTITAHQFRCWCKDEWEWGPEFAHVSSGYLNPAKAARK